LPIACWPPGSEWRLHREWFRRSALADLDEDAGLAEIRKLYRCHDRLLAHQQAVFIKLPHATAVFSNRRARLGLGDGSRRSPGGEHRMESSDSDLKQLGRHSLARPLDRTLPPGRTERQQRSGNCASKT
jgi:hypothetical protein